ncbi:hypothetical protein L1N85_01695 [Paenibacillus alkaliterrae]|uniref:hypothetical protein n=1 Tax=Paenibacillus alkaliterrae TaxID=320909 RepID=UPI001F3F5111|nr:hypothetical protein [Paenibacillus alkaliterrae]MCF2937145.1 hypothetical protein [Paenibacillus alkaliterrae]
MNDHEQKAKELFATYYGSFIQMHREGKLEKYKSYDISKEVESEWHKEMMEKFSRGLSITNWDALLQLQSLARNYQDSQILENIIAFTSRQIMSADSIVKLTYAETTIDLIKSIPNQYSPELIIKAFKVIIRILDDIIAKPLVIDPGHELNLFNLKDKKSLNNRAKKNIDAIVDYLN